MKCDYCRKPVAGGAEAEYRRQPDGTVRVCDFWPDDDLPAFIKLCKLLKFEEIPEDRTT